ncbi:MAG: hypothetical protein M3N49_03745 [Candidatus Eremiobacteraeota bacterium]|nr:hypothetical protein [Candidatus Eremiobacteraeota bacterium]
MDAPLDRLSAAALAGWTPVRVRETTGEIDWALINEPFTEPFFEQTADRAMRHPFNLAFSRRTPLAALEGVRSQVPEVAPAGFVFHMSRCGSTLIAQMLSRLSATIVLSEPQPLDAIAKLHERGFDEAVLIRWLRAMLSAIAVSDRGERRVFVKFHAWHVRELPFIARAFPGVPWIFVFREPRAVLRSQARNPGAEAMRFADGAGLEYTARVLAEFCNAALCYAGLGRSAFVDYATLPDAVTTDVVRFFDVPVDAVDVERMREAALVDTKANVVSSPARTPGDADDTLIERLAATWLDASYAALREAALR